MLPDNTGSFILGVIALFVLVWFLIAMLKTPSLEDTMFKQILDDLDREDEERRQREELYANQDKDRIDRLIEEQPEPAKCYLMSDGVTIRTDEGELYKLVKTEDDNK